MCVHLFSCTVIFDISYLPIHGKCGVFDLKDIGDSLEDLFTSFFVDFKGFTADYTQSTLSYQNRNCQCS